MEKTLVIIKPDAVQRQLVGAITDRFERKGLKIAAMRMLSVPGELARRMYSVHEGKEFYEPLLAFISAGPVVAMVIEGVGAIAVVRGMIGPTFGPDAPGGTIRGDFGMSRRYNLIHASDGVESARQEIPMFFGEDDIIQYDLIGRGWIYSAIDK